jgi:hypothetical protein
MDQSAKVRLDQIRIRSVKMEKLDKDVFRHRFYSTHAANTLQTELSKSL